MGVLHLSCPSDTAFSPFKVKLLSCSVLRLLFFSDWSSSVNRVSLIFNQDTANTIGGTWSSRNVKSVNNVRRAFLRGKQRLLNSRGARRTVHKTKRSFLTVSNSRETILDVQRRESARRRRKTFYWYFRCRSIRIYLISATVITGG